MRKIANLIQMSTLAPTLVVINNNRSLIFCQRIDLLNKDALSSTAASRSQSFWRNSIVRIQKNQVASFQDLRNSREPFLPSSRAVLKWLRVARNFITCKNSIWEKAGILKSTYFSLTVADLHKRFKQLGVKVSPLLRSPQVLAMALVGTMGLVIREPPSHPQSAVRGEPPKDRQLDVISDVPHKAVVHRWREL